MSAAGEIGGSHGRSCCPLRAACCVFGSHHKAGRTRVPTAGCAPPRHRCRKGNRTAAERPLSRWRDTGRRPVNHRGKPLTRDEARRIAANVACCRSCCGKGLQPIEVPAACIVRHHATGRAEDDVKAAMTVPVEEESCRSRPPRPWSSWPPPRAESNQRAVSAWVALICVNGPDRRRSL
jgi:hypothetical protein